MRLAMSCSKETGHTADRWEELGRFVVDGNRGAGTVHVFLARGARQVGAADAGDLEEIEIAFVDRDALAEAVRAGQISVLPMAAAALLGLAHLR
jgi:ADP-ribose pyrophosphatase